MNVYRVRFVRISHKRPPLLGNATPGGVDVRNPPDDRSALFVRSENKRLIAAASHPKKRSSGSLRKLYTKTTSSRAGGREQVGEIGRSSLMI